MINEVTGIIAGATSASNGGEAVNYTTTFTYDENGNVKTGTQGGITSTYTYNLLNLPTTIVSQGGETTQNMTYVYDDMGNVKEIVYPVSKCVDGCSFCMYHRLHHQYHYTNGLYY